MLGTGAPMSLADQTERATLIGNLLDERVLDLPDRLLDLLPVGVCVCDRAGLVVRYNAMAARLWGCFPVIGDPMLRFCGSYRLYDSAGAAIPHGESPMAEVLATGKGLRAREIVIERPDGCRIVALADIDAILDGSGGIVGAINVFREKPEAPSGQFPLKADWRSEELLQSLPVAIYTTDASGCITFYNDAAARLWGTRPVLGKSEFCGSWKLFWPDGTPMAHDQCPMALALKEKRPIRGKEAIAERPDGTRVSFVPYPTPFFDASGALIGAVNTLVDITERGDAEKRIRESEAQYRSLAAIVESSEDAILSKDTNGIITSWNQGAERLFGYTGEEVIGKSVTILIPPDRQEEEPAILARIHRGERIEHYETIRQRKDGGLVEISLTVSPVRNSEGRIIGASKIARDITEQKRAEERQRLLLREMNHRVKNLFTVSSGIVALSARSAKTPEELSSAARERLAALARAHELTLSDASGDVRRIEQPTTLHAVIKTVLLPFGSQQERFHIGGPDISISGSSITSFALLLHEFATNAAKYGALSTFEGQIEIECREEGKRFFLTWIERGGPRITHHANEQGFGTLIARAMVNGQLGGEISREWNPTGLTIRLSISKDRVSE
jgi:PAS domain S-box-containing protein